MPSIPLTIKTAVTALRDGQISSAELTAGMLDKITHLNPRVGAFIAVTADGALAAARQADADFAAGIDKGSLQGIPLGVKEIFATRDAPTTANSDILDRS